MNHYHTSLTIGTEESPNSIPVVILYEYHKRLPEGKYAPAIPEHVEITGLLKVEGLHQMKNINELLPYLNRERLENEILEKIL